MQTQHDIPATRIPQSPDGRQYLHIRYRGNFQWLVTRRNRISKDGNRKFVNPVPLPWGIKPRFLESTRLAEIRQIVAGIDSYSVFAKDFQSRLGCAVTARAVRDRKS